MAEGNKILGKVAFVDKGVYNAATRYDFFNFVTTEDSCYLSLKDSNTGHPVTDTAWWKCLANGKQATEAAREALNQAAEAGKCAGNRVGETGLFPVSTSHTTVRTVRYTAVH